MIRDVEYDNELMSDHNLVMCSFDGNGGIKTIDVGNILTVNKVKPSKSNKFMTTHSTYEDVFSFSFQVCKLSCNNINNNVISEEEVNHIMRWLNRKYYHKLKFIYDDNKYSESYYNGTFTNIQLVTLGDDVIGFNLTFESDSPYGYMEEIYYDIPFNKNLNVTIYDSSDEIGSTYCYAEIKCLQSGDLIIENENDPTNKIEINNCLNEEIIYLDGDAKIITSSLDHITLPSDFNYKFLRVVNTYSNRKNVFKTSIDTNITIKYTSVRKVGAVI